MTPQEQDMIDGLISRIRSTSVTNKDVAAEQRLQQGLAGSPDALYVLAQTVLVQQYGLGQAKAQLEAMQAQVQDLQTQMQAGAAQAKSSGGSFLSHIFGGGSGQPAAAPQQPSYQQVNNPGYGAAQYPPPGGYPPPPSYPPQGYPAPSSGMFGGGGFLQGALQTAAGVAAGEIAFQGMESLFHGFEHGGGGYERGFDGGNPGETVVNNYYDDNGDRGRSESDRGDSGFYNPDNDASRGGDGDRFTAGDGDDPGSNDGNSMDDSSSDSAGFDDNGSNDFSSDDNSGF